MEWKRVTLKDLKLNDATGTVTAMFSPFLDIDKQGDFAFPGAFGQQRVILSGYGHASWDRGLDALPVGIGKVYDQGDVGGVFEGQFNLETHAGQETYKTVKFTGDLQEWSYALPQIDSEIRTVKDWLTMFPNLRTNGYPPEALVRGLKKIGTNEVSPVLMGAGNGTRTLDVKQACPVHSTPTDGKPWDGPANEARLPSGKDAAFYRKAFAWQDPEGDPGAKSSWKFIHHFVDAEGTPGAASTRACSAGIAVLNGGRGGADIPNADREAVWRHLARHMRDAQMEPPELRSIDAAPKSMPLLDHGELVVVDATAFIERMKNVMDLAGAQGRRPSEAALKRAAELKGVLGDLSNELGRIIAGDRRSGEGFLGEAVAAEISLTLSRTARR